MAFNLSSAPVYPPFPVLDDVVPEVIKKIDTITEQKILSGFDYEVKGTTYHFSYDIMDQSNFGQMISDAILSMQLGKLSTEELIARYGAKEDGTLDTSKLPVLLPDKWIQTWQGHLISEDGKDIAVGLQFTINEFLALSNAGGMHNKNCLGEGWVKKAKIRAASSVAEVKALCKEMNIDEDYKLAIAKKNKNN